MPEFLTPVDIANRALQRCGADLIDTTLGFTEQSERARQTSSAYGKLRRAELQRNVWRFATRKACLRAVDTNTLLLAPTLWLSSTTYFAGSIVKDPVGTLWVSKTRNNLNNNPQSTNNWEPYFGPMTVALYDSSQIYFAGELVYTGAGDGTYNVYQSRISQNPIHPALPNQWSTQTTYFKQQVVQQFPAWSSGTTYSKGQSILYTDGNVYSSLVNSNLNITPPSHASSWAMMPVLTIGTPLVPVGMFPQPALPQSTPIAEWAQEQTYSIGSFVMFNGSVYLSLVNSNLGNFPNAMSSTSWVITTGGTLYLSLTDVNIGNSPSSSPTSWTTSFVQGGGNEFWLQVGGASFPNGVGLDGITIVYPLSSGPTWQLTTRNIYRLPGNYLRKASQDPKAGRTSFLGYPSNLWQDDWNFESDYIVSTQGDPIIFRFVGDVQDVTKFTDQFCEGLACRIALEVSPRLTQNLGNVGLIAKEYEKFMGEARLQNAIEIGAEEPPMDDYIACRV